MLEFIGSGLLGSLFGGLFRLAPEVLKFFDKKEDRKHELSMLDKQLEFEKLKGSIRIEEKYVDYSVAELQALEAAFNQQAAADSKAYKWVASLSALVRPGITIIIFALYVAFKLTLLFNGIQTEGWNNILMLWGNEDWAMLNLILSYYFINRSIQKYSK